MEKPFLQFCCLLAALVLLTGFGEKEKAEIEDLLDKKQFAAATTILTEALQENPAAEIYFYRAASYLGGGHFEDAVKDFDTALEMDPKYPNVYWNRGFAYASMGKFEEALKDFDLALERDDPKFKSMIYGLRSKVYYNTKEWDKAEADVREMMKLEPAQKESFQALLDMIDKKRNAPPEQEWTVERAREEAFRVYQKKLDVSKVPAVDPNLKQNWNALKKSDNGRVSMKDRFITLEAEGNYVVSYFNEHGIPRETYFFDKSGRTKSYRTFSAANYPRAAYIYCYDSCPGKKDTDPPFKAGELTSISFHPSQTEMFYFTDTGELLMHDKKP